jgi:chitinase
MMRTFPILCLAALLLATATTGRGADKLSVGYYPDWNRSLLPASGIRYQSLTHILHAFLIPNADGSVGGLSGYTELVQTAHQHNVKVMAVLGGWGQSTGFSPMAADTAARHRFVSNMANYCTATAYDGIDIDWEYPANAADRTNLRLLVHELRLAFDALVPRRLISIAAPSTSGSGQWFDVESMRDDLDWIGIMTYDYYGSWTAKAGPNSPLYGSFSTNSEGWIDYSASYYSGRGVPRNKLLIGTPFYGWVFNAATLYGTSTGASQATYSAIAPHLAQGWTALWDDVGKIPYMVNPAATQLITYDDSLSVAMKCGYILANNLGGTIIWALGQDKIGDRQPLLEVIGAFLRPTASVRAELPAQEQPAGFSLGQNYPNPFNGQTHIRYRLPDAGDVRMTLVDLLGRELRVLITGTQPAGDHDVVFTGDDLPSGTYFFRLAWHSHVMTRACVVIR